jgi:hypothetical protein
MRSRASSMLLALAHLTGCAGAAPSSPAPAAAPASCVVIYVTGARDDLRVDCLEEMVYAALLRRGYLVYAMRDDPWPEYQPIWDFTASVRLHEGAGAGRLQVELIVEEESDTLRAEQSFSRVAAAERPLDPKRRPTDAEVDGLVAAALDSNAAIRAARVRYGTSCEVRFRGPLRLRASRT